MTVEILTADQLTDTDRDQWGTIVQSNPLLDSPFFRPEFFDATASVRDGVRVAVQRCEHGASFLPMHVGRGGVAGASAGHMSDLEGAISPAHCEFRFTKLLAGCKLSSYRFAHLLDGTPVPREARGVEIPSPTICLADGFEAYVAERKESRGRLIADIQRKLRKAGREFETVEFVFDDRDPAAMEWITAEKVKQLHARKQWNFFDVPWTSPLLMKIWEHRSPEFRGLVSTFRYDGRIVAAHYGIQSESTLHSWIHVFDPSEKKTSPGIALQYLLAKHAAEEGITTIDLGRGDEDYKPRFSNGNRTIVEGSVERYLVNRLKRRAWLSAREAVRGTALGKPAQQAIRRLRTWKRTLLSSSLQ